MRIEATAALVFATLTLAQQFQPEIPKVWDEKEIEPTSARATTFSTSTSARIRRSR